MRLVVVVASVVLLLSTVRPAAANEPNDSLMWGITGAEVGFAVAAGVAARPGATARGAATLVNLTPFALGGAAWYLTNQLEIDASPAFAIHGAGWFGADLFLLGSLIDGRDKPFGLRAGTLAWTLGAVGAVAGGFLGATAIETKNEATLWLAAPIAGFFAGGLVGGGALYTASGFDKEQMRGRFTTGAIAGLTVGLGIATFAALRGGDTAAVSPISRAVESTPTPRRFMLSFGGAF